MLYILGGLVFVVYLLLAAQIKRAKRDTDAAIARLSGLFTSNVDALGKIADNLEIYIQMVQQLKEETEATIQERAKYSEGLLQKACFANQSSTIENLETLQDTMAFLRGKRR